MATRQLLYHLGHDHSVGTYITNYIMVALEWIFACILLFKLQCTKQSKFNLCTEDKKSIMRNRTYSCAMFFIFQATSQLTAGLGHQYFAHTYKYPNTPTGFYITAILTIVLFQIGNWFSFVMIGPIYQSKCCYKISINKIWYFYLVIISILCIVLLALDLAAPYSLVMIGITSVIAAVYFICYASNILCIDNCKCICSHSAQWFYICYGIVITFSTIVIQTVLRGGCATNNLPYSNNPNDDN
eukprot:84085_1